MTQPELPDSWDPAPLAAALDILANDTHTHRRRELIFDFGSTGTVALDLDPTQLPSAITDALLAQLAQLSLLAARANTRIGTPTR